MEEQIMGDSPVADAHLSSADVIMGAFNLVS
jgi:hypothetical protein